MPRDRKRSHSRRDNHSGEGLPPEDTSAAAAAAVSEPAVPTVEDSGAAGPPPDPAEHVADDDDDDDDGVASQPAAKIARVAQPPPVRAGVAVPERFQAWARADCHDAAAALSESRAAFGEAKYGQPLMTEDGRDSVEDALDEIGDFNHYVTKAWMNNEDVSSLAPHMEAALDLFHAANSHFKIEVCMSGMPTWCGTKEVILANPVCAREYIAEKLNHACTGSRTTRAVLSQYDAQDWPFIYRTIEARGTDAWMRGLSVQDDILLRRIETSKQAAVAKRPTQTITMLSPDYDGALTVKLSIVLSTTVTKYEKTINR